MSQISRFLSVSDDGVWLDRNAAVEAGAIRRGPVQNMPRQCVVHIEIDRNGAVSADTSDDGDFIQYQSLQAAQIAALAAAESLIERGIFP